MSGENRSITARDITGSSIVTGDGNTVTTRMTQYAPSPGHEVDVKAELAALRQALAALTSVPDRRGLNNALEDAADEAGKPEPDKDKIGGALEHVARYAKAADDFGEHAEKLVPRLLALASWLGPAWHHLATLLPS